MVGLDGVFRRISLDKYALTPGLRAVQWNDVNGWEEYDDGPNKEIPDIYAYQPVIDAWQRLAAEEEARAADPLYGLIGEERAQAQFTLAKQAADAALAAAASQPVEVPIPEGVWRYNGGDGSASAILGAVTLAEALGESTVTLWDHDNILRGMSLDSAQRVAVAIAATYRVAAYARAEAIAVARAEMDEFKEA